MPTHILDLDLSAPLPDLDQQDGDAGLLALVRWRGQPVGLARLDAVPDRLTGDQLRAAITAQVAPPEVVPPIPPAPAPLSIIVCTHERPDDLIHCLDALQPLAAAGHEVLIVDNAPRTSRTAALAARYPYRYLCEPRIGLDNARNCGLRAASHALVAYTDDDVVPDPRWVDALAQPFAAPEVGCVTGLVFPLELETPAQEQFEVYCAHRRTFTRRTFSAPELPPAAGGAVGMGANMAFRRDLLLRLGGFDPRLDGGTATCSGGDTDMFARVLASGARIVYTPSALVWHRHRREEAQLRKCIFGYGVGLYSFLTKRLVEAGDWETLTIGARWFAGPLTKAAWRRLRGRPTVPLVLLLLEMGGAFLGPLRYWQETKRQAASTRLSVSPQSPEMQSR